jgi:hypothetical protein
MELLDYNTEADEFLNETEDTDVLVKTCRAYFEIATGMRRPTEEEVNKVRAFQTSRWFEDLELTPVRMVESMMLPMLVPGREGGKRLLEFLMAKEYTVFEILARETSDVDGPFVPMFRYERLKQRKLANENRFDTALTRQMALFQTFLRMRLGYSRPEKAPFDQCVKEASDSDLLENDYLYDDIEKIWDIRCNYPHEWRVYLEEYDDRVLSAYGRGVRTIARLLDEELKRAYENYPSAPATQQYPAHWMRRVRGEPSGKPTQVNFPEARCPHCGKVYDPHDSLKTCPYCGRDTRAVLEDFYETGEGKLAAATQLGLGMGIDVVW